MSVSCFCSGCIYTEPVFLCPICKHFDDLPEQIQLHVNENHPRPADISGFDLVPQCDVPQASRHPSNSPMPEFESAARIGQRSSKGADLDYDADFSPSPEPRSSKPEQKRSSTNSSWICHKKPCSGKIITHGRPYHIRSVHIATALLKGYGNVKRNQQGSFLCPNLGCSYQHPDTGAIQLHFKSKCTKPTAASDSSISQTTNTGEKVTQDQASSSLPRPEVFASTDPLIGKTTSLLHSHVVAEAELAPPTESWICHTPPCNGKVLHCSKPYHRRCVHSPAVVLRGDVRVLRSTEGTFKCPENGCGYQNIDSAALHSHWTTKCGSISSSGSKKRKRADTATPTPSPEATIIPYQQPFSEIAYVKPTTCRKQNTYKRFRLTPKLESKLAELDELVMSLYQGMAEISQMS